MTTRLALLAVLVAVPGAAAQTDAPNTADAYFAALADAEAPGHARLVAQTWPALPDSLRRLLGGDPTRLAPGAGDVLTGWWWSQDPLPGTPENEAVVEHLRRVTEAVRRFPADERASGFDPRGDVFVMLGEPAYTKRLESRTLELALLQEPIPENELWSYGARRPVYLFVRPSRRQSWAQGGPLDLLPFWTQQTSTGVAALREMLPELAVADRNYLRALHTIDRALNPLEATPEFELDESVPGFASRRAFNLRYTVRNETRRATRRRDAEVEPMGPALPVVAEIPLAVRATRFRAANGGMRVEVAYAPEPGAYVGLAGAHAARSVATLTEAARHPTVPT